MSVYSSCKLNLKRPSSHVHPLAPIFLLLPFFFPHQINLCTCVCSVCVPVYTNMYEVYVHGCACACMLMCVCLRECVHAPNQLRTCQGLRMHVCMHVHIYVYVCVCVCICAKLCVCVCVCMCVRAGVRACLCACVHLFVCACSYMCVYMCVYCLCVRVRAYACAYVYVCVQLCVSVYVSFLLLLPHHLPPLETHLVPLATGFHESSLILKLYCCCYPAACCVVHSLALQTAFSTKPNTANSNFQGPEGQTRLLSTIHLC